MSSCPLHVFSDSGMVEQDGEACETCGEKLHLRRFGPTGPGPQLHAGSRADCSDCNPGPGAMTWKLEGYDAFSSEAYPLEGEYATEEEAIHAAKQRLLELENLQPSTSSGGQESGGIQDRVFIIGPNGQRRRIT